MSLAKFSFGLTAALLALSSGVAHGAGKQVSLEGKLELQIEDNFREKTSLTRHFLKTDSGKRYEL